MLSNPDYQAHVLAREEEKIAKRKAEIEARDAAKEARPMSAKRRFLEDKKKLIYMFRKKIKESVPLISWTANIAQSRA